MNNNNNKSILEKLQNAINTSQSKIDYLSNGKEIELIRDEIKLKENVEKKQEYKDEITQYLYIDSSSRDNVAFPSPGMFELTLSSPLTNVVEVGLVQAKFPLTDTAIHSHNNKIRFALNVGPGPTTIYEIEIPYGNYKPVDLALEITIQMNIVLFSVQLLASTHYINYTDGLVYSVGGNVLQSGCVKVNFNESRMMFIFSVLDGSAIKTNSPVLYLFAKKTIDNMNYFDQIDDIWDVLGFDRESFEIEGVDYLNEYVYISNIVAYTNGFNGGQNLLDLRYNYALTSNIPSLTSGLDSVILSIEPFNNNDIIMPLSSKLQKTLNTETFGRIFFKDASSTTDKSLEINNNSFPIIKKYKNGKSSINKLLIKVYRPDGTLCDFGFRNFTITLKILKLQAGKNEINFTT